MEALQKQGFILLATLLSTKAVIVSNDKHTGFKLQKLVYMHLYNQVKVYFAVVYLRPFFVWLKQFIFFFKTILQCDKLVYKLKNIYLYCTLSKWRQNLYSRNTKQDCIFYCATFLLVQILTIKVILRPTSSIPIEKATRIGSETSSTTEYMFICFIINFFGFTMSRMTEKTQQHVDT